MKSIGCTSTKILHNVTFYLLVYNLIFSFVIVHFQGSSSDWTEMDRKSGQSSEESEDTNREIAVEKIIIYNSK